MDLVIAGDRVTLAVMDACPLTPNLSLPPHYMKTILELQVGGNVCCKQASNAGQYILEHAPLCLPVVRGWLAGSMPDTVRAAGP